MIVSTGGRVEWAETFGEALEKLIGRNVIAKTDSKAAPAVKSDKAVTVPGGDDVKTAVDIAALAKHAQELYESALKAQRQGDWARYGAEIKKLGDVIAELEERLKIKMFTILFGALAVIVLVLMCFGIYIFAAYVFSRLGRNSW